MSMRYYAIEDYGLVLTGEEVDLIASKNCQDFNEQEYREYLRGSRMDAIEAVGTYASDFSGSVYRISDSGHDDFSDDTHLYDDTVFYIPLEHYPTIFSGAYHSWNDIISEMKDKVGEYLPADFDYRSRIRHIVGTVFG